MQAVLNYVTGSQRSEIFGKLNGSGAHVFLLNPNGSCLVPRQRSM